MAWRIFSMGDLSVPGRLVDVSVHASPNENMFVGIL
jgi:hypothetical protein